MVERGLDDRSGPSRGVEAIPQSTVNRWDLVVLLAIACYALAFQLGRWQGFSPFTHLAGDAGNIASYAAALDRPELFTRDSSLGDPRQLRFYGAVHVRLLRHLQPYFGDYGSAYLWLLGLHVFLLGASSYLFGRLLFRSRFWAALLAAVLLMPVMVGLGTYWGTFRDAQPRFSYAAVLPLLWSAALAWHGKPRLWPLLLGIAGALVFIHPVSAPSWGAAFLLGLCLNLVDEPRRRYHLAMLIASIAVFAVAVAPFATLYLSARGDSPELEFDVWKRVISPTYRDALHGFEHVVVRLWDRYPALLPWGIAAALFQVGWGRFRRDAARIVVLWTLAIVAVSVGIPWLEQSRAELTGAVPMQVDLIRGLRFLAPLLLLFCVWSLVELDHRLRRATGNAWERLPRLAGAILAAAWIYQQTPRTPKNWLAAFREIQPVPHAQRSEALERIASLPRDATLVTSSIFLSAPVRYYALHPLAHSRLDLGVFLYARHDSLPQWQSAKAHKRRARALYDPADRLLAFARLASRLGADYALVELAPDRCVEYARIGGTLTAVCEETAGGGSCHELVWINPGYALIRADPRHEAQPSGDSSLPASSTRAAPSSLFL